MYPGAKLLEQRTREDNIKHATMRHLQSTFTTLLRSLLSQVDQSAPSAPSVYESCLLRDGWMDGLPISAKTLSSIVYC